MSNEPPIKSQNFDASQESFHFFELSLRDDLAHLIGVALEKMGWNQRRLAKEAGMQETYVSRLANADTNFKIKAVAKVLQPAGIMPMLVDKAEIDRLRNIEERSQSRERNTVRVHSRAKSRDATVNIYESASIVGAPGPDDSVGRSRQVFRVEVQRDRPGTLRNSVVLPRDRGNWV